MSDAATHVAPRAVSKRDHPLTRSVPGMIGMAFLAVILLACVATLPWTLGTVRTQEAVGGAAGVLSPRYDVQYRTARQIPPSWWGAGEETGVDTAVSRLQATARLMALERIAKERGTSVEALAAEHVEPTAGQIDAARPLYLMGTDLLGRDVFVRTLAGGGISLGIGIAAALLSVILGTLYGSIAGYIGGRVDAVMMRIVDILYGLPYILLVVLLAVAADGVLSEYVSREKARTKWVRKAAVELAAKRLDPSLQGGGLPDLPAIERLLDAAPVSSWTSGEAILRGNPAVRAELERQAAIRFPERIVSGPARTSFELCTLLIAIGGVSWLTMARVIRGQVLSLKAQPFVEAARAIGVPTRGIFLRHLLPNLVGPIVVYATLTVPQAILQESFLSFLGIGVRAPMPSWGNLAAEGLGELNPVKSHWWLLLFPCLMLGSTLLALNFVGEGLREAMDPKRTRR